MIDTTQPPLRVLMFWNERERMKQNKPVVFALRACDGNSQPCGYTLAWDTSKKRMQKFADEHPDISPCQMYRYAPQVSP